jgi:hypothetical protein
MTIDPYILTVIGFLTATLVGVVLWQRDMLVKRITALEEDNAELRRRIDSLMPDAVALTRCKNPDCPVRDDTASVPRAVRAAAIILLLLAILSSCVAAGGRGDAWAVVSVGTDAATFTAGRDGVDILNMNQSASFDSARRHLRTAAMMQMGGEIISAAPDILQEATR